MANNNAWQTAANNNIAQSVPMEKNFSAVKKDTEGVKASSLKMKVVLPKRYSVDDTGGGYEGL